MTQHLESAAHHMGATLDQPGQPAAALKLPGGAAVPLSTAAGRLFCDEVAALHGAVNEKLRGKLQNWAGKLLDVQGEGKGKQEQEAEQEEDVQVYHSTLVGLQALKDEGGAAVAAATEALSALLHHVAGEMQRAYGDDVMYQINLVGDAPAEGREGLEEWRQVARRSMLEGRGRPGGRGKGGRGFACVSGCGASMCWCWYMTAFCGSDAVVFKGTGSL